MTASHQTVRLAKGRHRSPGLGACVMELASMLAGERFSDRPATASPVIAAFLRTYNDGIDDGRRQDLYPLAAAIVGTAACRGVERERMSRCLEFARSFGAGAPSGRGAVGIASPEASGSWAALAALRGPSSQAPNGPSSQAPNGPSSQAHARALAFVNELVALQSSARPRRWPARLLGRDPGQAVEQALGGAGAKRHDEGGGADGAARGSLAVKA